MMAASVASSRDLSSRDMPVLLGYCLWQIWLKGGLLLQWSVYFCVCYYHQLTNFVDQQFVVNGDIVICTVGVKKTLRFRPVPFRFSRF